MALWRFCRGLLAAFTLLCAGLSMAQNTKPFENTLAQRLQACTGCHGEQGRAGPDAYYPRLAGKPALYLYKQLLDFRDGRRHYPLMTGLLQPLSDAYLFDIAQHFAALDLPYPPNQTAPASAKLAANQKAQNPAWARGEQLALQGDLARQLPACASCHGDKLTGQLPKTPGLLGLSADYLNAQLGGWRTGRRAGQSPDCMGHVARRLQPADIAAVSSWLAGQAIPANTRPAPAAMATSPSNALRQSADLTCAATTAPMPQQAKQPTHQAPEVELPPLAQRGAYLARLGHCQTCHSQPGQAPWAGGRPIDTPFGLVFSSNLTSDKTHGLGQWSADDFWQALHHGKGRNGRLLLPVFPYANYSLVTREDADALFAYLQQIAPVARDNQAHQLRWPYNTQWALWIWRALFFKPLDLKPDATQSAQWNRGRYLVQGLGHCSACHSDRNALGATGSPWFQTAGLPGLTGGVIPMQNWYAPALSAAPTGVLAGWQTDELQALLKDGVTATASASGPMALVVQGSTQYWTDADLQAVGAYLLAPVTAPGSPPPAPTSSVAARAEALNTSGAKLYDKHCAQCHGDQGQGTRVLSARGVAVQAYPRLTANPAITQANPVNLVQTVLYGGFAPAVQGNPQPFGMPPYVLDLSDAQIAAVLTHVRRQWGNQAPPVSELDVGRVRNSTGR